MIKGLVLNSGGVDSTTCVAYAIDKLGKDNVSTVSIVYGQKHEKELKCAEQIAEYYGVEHYVLDLTNVFKFSNCPLLKGSTKKIVHKSYAEQIAENGEGMVETYVPFRNGLMLSAAASLACSIYENEEVEIYLGAHADDAAGEAYADCSKKFSDAMYRAISIGTYGKVKVTTPFVQFTKDEVVGLGLELKVPYELTWSCYEGGEVACGTCGTCIDRKQAFLKNGVSDPIPYKKIVKS